MWSAKNPTISTCFCVQIRQLSPIMFIANGKLDKTRSFYVASAWTQTGTRRVQISKHFLLWFWHINKWSLVWDFSLLAREVMRIILRIPNCSINNDQNESMISPGLTFTSEGWLQVILRVSPRTKCFAGNWTEVLLNLYYYFSRYTVFTKHGSRHLCKLL